MASFYYSLGRSKSIWAHRIALFFILTICVLSLTSRSFGILIVQDQEPAPQKYIKEIFQGRLSVDRLSYLNKFSGAPAKDLVHDKQFHKLMHDVVPDCLFHYGTDIQLADVLESMLKESSVPVQVRDSRYLLVSSQNAPNNRGRAFLWFDLQDGIGLGGIFFSPSNGEPSPTFTIFSRQIRTQSLSFNQLPSEFAEDIQQWSRSSSVPRLTTRYFITGSNEKILLEHDEFDCESAEGVPSRRAAVCEQMNLDAADIDMNAAYYLEQTSHLPNATARMITGEEQVNWMHTRESSCRLVPDPFHCRVHMTRIHIHVIIHTSPSHRR